MSSSPIRCELRLPGEWITCAIQLRISQEEGSSLPAVVVKTVLDRIPCWLVGEFSTHFRTYFIGQGNYFPAN